MPSGQPAGCRRYKSFRARKSRIKIVVSWKFCRYLAENRRLTTDDCLTLPTLLQIGQDLLGNFFQGLEHSRTLESHRFYHRLVLAAQLF
jgi:hypothetical protein